MQIFDIYVFIRVFVFYLSCLYMYVLSSSMMNVYYKWAAFFCRFILSMFVCLYVYTYIIQNGQEVFLLDIVVVNFDYIDTYRV